MKEDYIYHIWVCLCIPYIFIVLYQSCTLKQLQKWGWTTAKCWCTIKVLQYNNASELTYTLADFRLYFIRHRTHLTFKEILTTLLLVVAQFDYSIIKNSYVHWRFFNWWNLVLCVNVVFIPIYYSCMLSFLHFKCVSSFSHSCLKCICIHSM